MHSGPYELIPLTDDDKDLLFTIFDHRRRLLLSVYVFLIATGIFVSLGKSAFPMWIGGMIFIESIIIGSGLYLLATRVLPFRKDIRSGAKEKVPFTIVGKQYFPITNQYFLNLDDDKYRNHETDEHTYNSVTGGDCIYLFRAKCSKYFFEKNGRYSII